MEIKEDTDKQKTPEESTTFILNSEAISMATKREAHMRDNCNSGEIDNMPHILSLQMLKKIMRIACTNIKFEEDTCNWIDLQYIQCKTMVTVSKKRAIGVAKSIFTFCENISFQGITKACLSGAQTC